MISCHRIFTAILPLLAVLALILNSSVAAQTPVVYGVFFYWPTCPHCQDVINNHWDAIQSEFGDQLQVLFINASTSEGGQMMRDARTALGVQANGVPMLMIGSEVLMGSVDIPRLTPTIVRAGLEAGGIGLPAIPGIEAIYNATVEETSQNHSDTQTNAAFETEQTQTLAERLGADPVANGLALVILVLLVLSAVTMLRLFGANPSQNAVRRTRRYQHIVLTLIALIGLGMALSLLAGWDNNAIVLMLAAGEGVIFLIIAVIAFRRPLKQALPRWLVPLVAVGGFAVAAYLSFVELNLTDAVCGVVGNCNAVQQSSYARILNIPIGLLGMASYVTIVILWLLSRESRFRVGANWLVRMLVLLGVLFSIYLTFLEPFVIGATCIWCLTSAVVMLALLWLLAPPTSEVQERHAYFR